MGTVAELTFEDWLEHAFGHEVRYQRPPWFFDADCAWWDPESATAISYLTRLFQAPDILPAQYSDDQIAAVNRH